MYKADFRQFGKGYKKGGGFDMRTKKGRQMEEYHQGCVSAFLFLPTLFIKCIFQLFKYMLMIAFWPITLIVWLARRNR